MSEGFSALATKAARPKALVKALLVLAVLVILLIAGAAAPYVFKGATLEGEVAAQLRATTGLKLQSVGDARFGLLPTPHITLTNVVLKRPDGALAVARGRQATKAGWAETKRAALKAEKAARAGKT